MAKLNFETAVEQEVEYLKKMHPTAEDIPSCMQLFDTFLSCNGTRPRSLTPLRLASSYCSRKLAGKVSVQVRTYGGM